MCRRYLGFVLLLWLPAALCAQHAALSCHRPQLNGGYFLPELTSYPDGAQLTYACDNGFKPPVDAWWATSKCENGTWSHKPECIDVFACLPPTIRNANYAIEERGWYNNGEKIRIKCDQGYEFVNRDATALCVNGTWTSVPECLRSQYACGEPPQIPHAVIIDQEYKELFAIDSEVLYQCEAGYTLVGGANNNSIFCIYGGWTDAQPCFLESHRKTQPGTGDTGFPGSGGSGRDDGPTTSPSGLPMDPESGSSSSSESDQRPAITKVSIRNCRNRPIIPHGDFVDHGNTYLKFKCSDFYVREGPERVYCYNNGEWSTLPSCRATFCRVNTLEYPQLVPVGVRYVKDGDSLVLKCVRLPDWWTENYAVGRCRNAEITFAGCCSSATPIRLCRGHITHAPW